MNFINVIVHSAEDMNFRVHLQHEFTLLGLDDFITVCCNASWAALVYSSVGRALCLCRRQRVAGPNSLQGSSFETVLYCTSGLYAVESHLLKSVAFQYDGHRI